VYLSGCELILVLDAKVGLMTHNGFGLVFSVSFILSFEHGHVIRDVSSFRPWDARVGLITHNGFRHVFPMSFIILSYGHRRHD
jgi:uncharacterized membrane protein YagU involved in acid resistance